MEGSNVLPHRALSVSTDNKNLTGLAHKSREIVKAITTRNPHLLLNSTFTRCSMTPTNQFQSEKSDNALQLMMLKKTINRQKISMESGDKTVIGLKHELKQLDIQVTKREFWNRQHASKIKQLEKYIEETLRLQIEEEYNQDIYLHLLKRMKKTKIFLEIHAFNLTNSLENRESILTKEKRKKLHMQEAACQAFSAFKDLHSTYKGETEEGNSQIFELKKSIEKSRVLATRREEWKKHQETMYEAAVIEDRSAKNMHLKESLSLHKFWYNILDKIFERKQAKFQRLEEAFQSIKIVTGIPDISQVVENFLTKEQTYVSFMETVKKKEDECSKYHMKIKEMQEKVDLFSNRDNDKENIIQIKDLEQQKIREMMEVAPKKYAIKNKYSKVQAWMKLMIRKFNKIMGRPNGGILEDGNIMYYVMEIKEICKAAVKEHEFHKNLGKAIENNRKQAVNMMIEQFSKVPKAMKEIESVQESDLIGIDVDIKPNTRK
ncbi:hypothetical protein SteCoe_15241 [Stentor coeruleus]|uniref:ODAD1 central coiled coil region domain-containing protein n=1 Tax=Stentor coeruleus TaxID=5963 RepID=A0A1R2C409_9CILI|nr:hypothetical protein SteCoe_15241 [Stentor coeruleus]